MTNLEAVKTLSNGVLNGKDDTLENNEAIELAISALENIDRIKAERDKAIAERDAFMEDFKKGFRAQIEKEHGIFRCDICKYGGDDVICHINVDNFRCPPKCNGYDYWEWRGVQND